MFTLLPGVGVALPHGAGTLRFGMPEPEAQWLVSTLGDVRAGWICGAAWAFEAAYGDLAIGVLGGPPDRPGVAEVHFERQGGPATVVPGFVPVVWAGVDLFGYPVSEVEAALPQAPAECGLTLVPTPVSPPPPAATGRRPRHAAAGGTPAGDRYLTRVRLVRPERRPPGGPDGPLRREGAGVLRTPSPGRRGR